MSSGPQLIKKKQKLLIALKTLSFSFLCLIPLTINFLNKFLFKPWQITVCVTLLAGVILIFHRLQLRFRRDIEKACHGLGPGVKLFKKYNKSEDNKYQIFQEGHRYYHLQHLQTGEKRLVQKDKILQDFDIAL